MTETPIKEVPIAKVRSNQIGIVITLLIAIIAQIPWLIAVVWLVQIMTRLLGAGANAFIIILEPIGQKLYGKKNTESLELQNFNLSLGITFLTISIICISLNWTLAAYIFAGMMMLAALAALLGYCIGCTIYYQYKKYQALRKSMNKQA